MINTSLKNLSDKQLFEVAKYFRALGEVSRLKILQALNSGEKNVSELSTLTELNQSNVSRHLAVLLEAGVINRRRKATYILYSTSDRTLHESCSPVCKKFSNHRNHNK